MVKNRNKNRVFRFNRRIRGQTDYQLRLKLLKSQMMRVVIRKSNNNMLVQFVDYAPEGDKIVTSVKSDSLKKYKYDGHTGNIVSAYLTGYLAGKRLLKTKFKGECIVDFGLQRVLYGNRLFATVKGVKDAGVNVLVDDVVFPSESRLKGEHLTKKIAVAIEDVKKEIGKVVA